MNIKKYKISIYFIIIGLLSTIISFIVLNDLYQKQNDWIKAETTLYKIIEINPLDKSIPNDYDKGYYGEYLFTINETTIHLFSEKVSDAKYVEDKITFYINPKNYKDYHPEFNKNTKYLSFLGLGFCIIGFIDYINNKQKGRIYEQ